ncbi:hypothetical protein [Enterococcus sp. AZ109]
MNKILSFIHKDPFKQLIQTNIINHLQLKENRYWSQEYARFRDHLDRK